MKHIITMLMMLFPAIAAAHPGHEHDHWSSMLIHAGWAGSLVAVAVAIGYYIKKRNASKED
uniref:hypothetical protein n=1 Tax=Thaumasiovibrio occultus TaxID=1891184 RepID=UPI00131B4F2E|nr:hypothetical protein [Thaumasiovibrio occultus]